MWIKIDKTVTLPQLAQINASFQRKRKKPNLRIVWANADGTIGMCSFTTLENTAIAPGTIFQIWKFV